MAYEKFPWLEKIESNSQEVPEIPNTRFSSLSKYREGILLSFFIVALIIGFKIFANKSESHSASAPLESHGSNQNITALMLMLPTAQGEPILPESVKLVSVRASALTKNQRLQLLGEEDLQKLSGKLVAKRDLPSTRPLTWSDIRIAKPEKSLTPKTKILFSKEEP